MFFGMVAVMVLSLVVCFVSNMLTGNGGVCVVRIDKYGEQFIEVPWYVFLGLYSIVRGALAVKDDVSGTIDEEYARKVSVAAGLFMALIVAVFTVLSFVL